MLDIPFSKIRSFIGIDPGKEGAIARIDANREILLLCDIPLTPDKSAISKRGLAEIFSRFSNEDVFAIEDSKAMKIKDEKTGEVRDQSPASMLTFGINRGILEGLILWTGAYYREVPPRTWQAPLGVKGKSNGKSNTSQIALSLFPNAVLYEKGRGNILIEKNGRSDALNMAEWLRRQCERNAPNEEDLELN